MPLDTEQQEVVDALTLALANYEQYLPPETIKQINALGKAINNNETDTINELFWKIENYPHDFKAEYDRIKQLMQSEEVSKEKDKCIGEDVNLPTPEGLKSNISAAILQAPDPQKKAKETFSPDFLAKFLRKNLPQY